MEAAPLPGSSHFFSELLPSLCLDLAGNPEELFPEGRCNTQGHQEVLCVHKIKK